MEKQTVYRGQCHCGAIRFAVRSEPITTGIRCNCSICAPRGLVMSSRYYPRADFDQLEGLEGLECYRFGDRVVNHYFCRRCGIYPFADNSVTPEHYRLNLGCLEGVEPLKLSIQLIDGRSF